MNKRNVVCVHQALATLCNLHIAYATFAIREHRKQSIAKHSKFMPNRPLPVIYTAQNAIKNDSNSLRLQAAPSLLPRLRLLNLLQRASVCGLPFHPPIGAAAEHDGGSRAGGAEAVVLRKRTRPAAPWQHPVSDQVINAD